MTSTPPPRPESDSEGETGFVKQSMVCWLSPKGLAATGARVALSAVFGSYADKRELQAALQHAEPFDYSADSELWLDYISDLGDGFESTYHMARLLALEKLDIEAPVGGGADAVSTPAGKILIMGGDQVYPAASKVEYENRMIGPYRAALPWSYTDRHLYAIPGNHDWYDGLTSFIRVFCQKDWIGGWKTQQPRSYFALQLPHRWWLWGIDIQFDNYIDEPQLRYFDETVGAQLQPGDSIILCSAKPSWVKANMGHSEAYVNLDYFDRKVIEGRGADVRLFLTGDLHHYAHYEPSDGEGAHYVTAGGGGAYLSATHQLPDELELPPAASRDPGKSRPSKRFQLKKAFPDRATSNKIRRGIFDLPFENPGFWGLCAVLQGVFGWIVAGNLRGGAGGGNIAHRLGGLSIKGLNDVLFRSALGVGALILLVVALAMFTQNDGPLKRWLLGGIHAAIQYGAILVTIRTAAWLLDGWDGPMFWVPFFVFIMFVGGLLSAALTGIYLYIADAFSCNTNELFAAQRIMDYKNFLRLHIDADGVTIYPIGVQKVPRKMKLVKEGERHEPWFEPASDHTPARLIEAPIHVKPAPKPATAPSS